ncbi:exported hypothetical protein [[Clostridium] ultunense Esp]|nr:exported hypothetical protein [[Clostridium] ultunense Esp]
MKKITSYVIFLPVLLVLLTMSACRPASNPQALVGLEADKPLESLIKELTDPAYKGRLTGTEENHQLTEKLAGTFQAIGLAPFQGSFLYAYEQDFYDPDLQKYRLAVRYKDGTKKELVYGKDFLEQAVAKDESLTLPVTFDPEQADGKAFITADKEQMVRMTQSSTPKLILYAGAFYKTLYQGNYQGTPILQISPAVDEQLKAQQDEIESIEAAIDLQEKRIAAHNVVGVIKGAGGDGNHRDAVIVSAHMDHLGWDPSGVYVGAIDNATGTATMVELARELQSYAAKKPFKKDLVFIAYNGEESMLKGSEAMAEALQKAYSHLYVINLDSIGAVEGGILLISGQEGTSAQLQETMVHHLKLKQITTALTNEQSSDHNSFEQKGISAVTLIQENIFDRIHTTKDIMDQIDFPFLYKIKEAVFDFIIQNDNREFSPGQMSTDNAEEFNDLAKEIMDKELASLKLGQYKLVLLPDGSARGVMQSRLSGDTADAVKPYFPEMEIPQQIGEYVFDRVEVNVDLSTNILEDPRKLELNRVYQAEVTKDDIVYLKVMYRHPDTDEVLSVGIQRGGESHTADSPNVTVEQIEVDSLLWTIATATKNKQIVNVSTTIEQNQQTYNVSVSKGKEYVNEAEHVYGIIPNWDRDEIASFLKSIRVSERIGNLMK